MSSPDQGFTLPVMVPDEPGLPVMPPQEPTVEVPASTIPVTPPPTIPVAPPTAIPVSPPPPPIGAPVAPGMRADNGIIPVAPPTASEAGIVAVDRTGGNGEPEVMLDEVLLYLLEKGGSDLHLSVNSPPMIRVHGDLEAVPGYRALTGQQLQEAVYAILTDRQKQKFEETKELDLAYQLPGAARFRVNLMQQQGNMGAVLRAIPWEILPLEALRMPPILGDFADLPRGLVLVT